MHCGRVRSWQMAMSGNCKLLCICLLLLAHAAAASGAGVQIAVYWGQNSDEGSLARTCSTGRYALVLIASLSVFGDLQTPRLDLAGHCDPSRNGCVGLAGEIASCQATGVKVLLSIGGSGWSYGLVSDEAQGVASHLWNNYLGGTSRSRPFGNAVLDGIDFDIQIGGDYFDDLAKNLTALYKSASGGKTYLLTAAPRCPYPDAALDSALGTGLFDHVWVKFYSNPSCKFEAGNVTNIRSAWEQWTRALPSASIFLGLAASPDAASGSGFIDPQILHSVVLPVVNGSANYGGIMLWNRYYDTVNEYSSKLLGKADPPAGSPIPGASSSPPAAIDLPIAPSAGPLPKKSIRIYIIVGASSICALFIILSAFFLWYKKYFGMVPWQRGSRNAPRIESFLEKQESAHPKRYTYSEVRRMTESFAHKLGQGGYGSVYRGNMLDGREIAVKMLKDTEGNDEDFTNEVGSISRTSHVNVVTLIGFCLQGSKRALIYEYMPNGSLDKYKFGSNFDEGGYRLTWDRLFNIVVGVARGLEYLHSRCNTRIVHFDIKPQNILLDQDFCPKISDFGLAKLCRQKESKVSIVGARGTIGYMAPEVFSRNYGPVSSKSDVYSYGMVVLEKVGAKKQVEVSTESSSMYFPQWIYDNLDQFCGATTCEISSEITGLVRKMTIVGLWCIQARPSDRPSMSKVLEMLESNSMDLEMPPKAFFGV